MAMLGHAHAQNVFGKHWPSVDKEGNGTLSIA